MEIIGIGIDIIEVSRIKNAITTKKNFLNRIYSNKEIKLSDRGKFRFEELAGRFAVKEAILKAIKTGWRRGVKFNEIIVLNEPSGAPYVNLIGKTQKFAESLGVKNIFVSISHTKELAIGMAIVTK
ncbi:holo-ACP synthase [candidate division WOR-3 bacterium]|jgi:holo-[acyl-carrier protein] synthase|nr:holo-ACP synthase [candidate division WOR-3 bacterium]